MKSYSLIFAAALITLLGLSAPANAETKKTADEPVPVQVGAAQNSSTVSAAFSGNWGDELSNQWKDFYQEMQKMRTEMEKFMDTALPAEGAYHQSSGGMTMTRSFEVKTDIAEAEKEYVISMDLPGTRKEDLGVEVRDGMLIVTGKREDASEKQEQEKNYQYHYRERSTGTFQRSLRLPDDVDATGPIEAKYNDGVLKIRLPKAPEADSQPVKVAVQ